MVFHSVLNSDYHVIIKYLKKVFEGKFDCLEENTEKCKTFSVTIITWNYKNHIFSQIQFIDLSSFMTRLLSNLVDNLAQEIHKIKYKHGHDNKK